MSENIFRAFSFFNDRSSSANKIGENIDADVQAFHTLGYFDKFVTRKIQIKENELPNMNELWVAINRMNEGLIDTKNDKVRDESFQNIFGVALQDEDSDIEICDKSFWNNNYYAYTFVILVQFYNKSELKLKEKIDLYKKSFIKAVEDRLDNYKSCFIDGVYDELEDMEYLNNISFESKFLITDYITYDRYDYILAVKSNFYLPIVSAMQQLYALKVDDKVLAVKSFTVPAFNNNAESLINEKVPSISIECSYNESNMYLYNKNNSEWFEVEKYLSWFCDDFLAIRLYPETIRQKQNLFYISGEHDLRINAQNVRMADILNTIGELSSDYLYGFSTTINVPHKKINCASCKSNNYTTDGLVEKIVACSRKIVALEEQGYPKELTKTLHQINSGLSAIRPVISQYRGYGFYSLFTEFEFYLKMLLGVDKNSSNSIVKAFEVAKAFGSALLTTIRSDFRGFQIPTFNANLYYAPTKLLVFYRAFISSLLKSYSKFNKRSNEHFIICIENKINIDVEQKLKVDNGDKKVLRFFVCRMSEKNLYSIKDTMIQLNHEIAHYGLGVIRDRRQRAKYLVDSFIKAYLLLFRLYLYNSCFKEKTDSSYRPYLEYIACKAFATKFVNLHKEYLLLDIMNDPCESFYFNDTVNLIGKKYAQKKEYFTEAIYADIMNNVKGDSNNINEMYRNYTDFCALLRDSLEQAGNQVFVDSKDKKISKVCFLLEYCFKECFADVVAILTLRLKPMDYLKALINANEDNRIDSDMYLLKYRFYVVFETIKKCSKQSLANRWSKQELREIAKNENEIVSKIKDTYLHLGEVLVDFSDFNDKKVGDYIRELLAERDVELNFTNILLYDLGLFENFKNYISICIELYIQKDRKINNDFSPSKIYNNLQNPTITEQIGYIDHILKLYEKFSSNEDTS